MRGIRTQSLEVIYGHDIKQKHYVYDINTLYKHKTTISWGTGRGAGERGGRGTPGGYDEQRAFVFAIIYANIPITSPQKIYVVIPMYGAKRLQL